MPGTTVELEIRPSAAGNARVVAVIVAAAVISLTLIYLITGAGSELFAPHTTLSTFVPDAAGLQNGSEVRLSGIPIGNVSRIGISGLLDPQRIVKVEMYIDSRYLRNIPSDSQTIISADTLIGDQFLGIDEGKSPLPVTENATLASEPIKQAVDRADLIRGLQDELRQVDDIVTQASSPDAQLGKFLLGSNEYNQVLMRIDAFQKAMHALVGPDSQLGPAIFSNDLYPKIRDYVTSVDKTLATIQRGEGVAGRLFASDRQYTDLLTQLREFRKSIASASGSVRDDAAYRRIRDLLAQTDAAIAAMNVSKDQQLYESLNGSLKSVRALLEDFRLHPEKYMRYKVN